MTIKTPNPWDIEKAEDIKSREEGREDIKNDLYLLQCFSLSNACEEDDK